MTFSKTKRNNQLHWLFLCGILVLTVFADVYIASNFLDGDASQPFLRGWQIAKQRNLFTSDLYLTTDFSIIDTSVVAAGYFLLFSDWTLVRILTMLTQQAGYLFSFLYLCRQSGVQTKPAVYAGSLLLLPVSIPYARAVLYHMYYLPKLVVLFLIIAFTVRLAFAENNNKHIGSWTVLSLLWLISGAEGIRQMMLIGIPMLAYLTLDLLHLLSNYQYIQGKLTGSVPFQKTKTFRLLKVLLLSFACFSIGFICNKLFITRLFAVGNSSYSWYWPEVTSQHYADIFHGWLKANGIRVSFQQLVGIRGIAIVACLLFFSYMIGISARALPGKADYFGTTRTALVRSLYVISLITTTLIFIFDCVFRLYELYYIPVVALAFPVLAQEMDFFTKQSSSATRKLLLVLVCFCAIFQGIYSLVFISVDKEELDSWNGLTYTEVDTVDQVRDCVEFMQSNGYTYGFINYWYANPMIEMSNGELMVGPLVPDSAADGSLDMMRWGTYKSAFEKENMPAKVIVFIQRVESASFEEHCPEAMLLMEGWIFNGYEVDASLIK